jgi:hypothetical protein
MRLVIMMGSACLGVCLAGVGALTTLGGSEAPQAAVACCEPCCPPGCCDHCPNCPVCCAPAEAKAVTPGCDGGPCCADANK